MSETESMNKENLSNQITSTDKLKTQKNDLFADIKSSKSVSNLQPDQNKVPISNSIYYDLESIKINTQKVASYYLLSLYFIIYLFSRILYRFLDDLITDFYLNHIFKVTLIIVSTSSEVFLGGEIVHIIIKRWQFISSIFGQNKYKIFLLVILKNSLPKLILINRLFFLSKILILVLGLLDIYTFFLVINILTDIVYTYSYNYFYENKNLKIFILQNIFKDIFTDYSNLNNLIESAYQNIKNKEDFLIEKYKENSLATNILNNLFFFIKKEQKSNFIDRIEFLLKEVINHPYILQKNQERRFLISFPLYVISIGITYTVYFCQSQESGLLLSLAPIIPLFKDIYSKQLEMIFNNYSFIFFNRKFDIYDVIIFNGKVCQCLDINFFNMHFLVNGNYLVLQNKNLLKKNYEIVSSSLVLNEIRELEFSYNFSKYNKGNIKRLENKVKEICEENLILREFDFFSLRVKSLLQVKIKVKCGGVIDKQMEERLINMLEGKLYEGFKELDFN